MSKNPYTKLFIVISVFTLVTVFAPILSPGENALSAAPDGAASVLSQTDGTDANSASLFPTPLSAEPDTLPNEAGGSLAAHVPTTITRSEAALETSSTPSADPANIALDTPSVPNELIIHFVPAAAEDARAAYIQSIHGTTTQTIAVLNAVVVSLPSDIDPQNLPASPLVLQTEPNYQASAQQTNSENSQGQEQWSLTATNAPAIWQTLPADARQAAVAVIDSGICADHPDLQGRILPGWDFVDNDAVPQDEMGHGCAVAGIIAANANNNIGIDGIAPNAQVMPLRVLDKNGVGRYSDVAAAIVYAVDNGADILDLSLGGAYASPLLESAVAYATSHGKIVIAAAGNTSSSTLLYPAAYSSVISVGSLDSNLGRSTFSASGESIKRMLPGQDILTTSLNGDYTLVSGTSFAAAHAAGLKALELALGKPLPSQLFHSNPASSVKQPPLNTAQAGGVAALASDQQTCGVELMLVLDGSGSIGSANFDVMRDFAHNIVSSFTLGPNDARIGLVQFSDSAVLESPLVDSADSINGTINSMGYQGGITNTQSGIDLGQSQLAAGRSGIPHVMIVMTDGMHNTGGDPGAAADNARAAGTQVYAVGVGSGVNMSEIVAIAGGSANVIALGDFSGLAKTIQSLSGGACALSITGVEFKEQHLVLGGWRDLERIQDGNNFYDRTFDGNRVQILITVENHSNQNQQAAVRVLDANFYPAGADDFQDLDGQVNCSGVQDFPPGQKQIKTCFWDTTGFAWNSDGSYNLTQKIVIKVVNTANTQTYDRTRVDDNTVEVWPKPLILVHGIWATSSSWDAYLGSNSFIRTLHPHWLTFAVDDGSVYQPEEMFTGGTVGYPFGINTIAKNAGILADYIQNVREYLNVQHVDILAHSMGGLIARQYINDRMNNGKYPTNDDRTLVSHLVMFGTPNWGSACAWLYRFPSTRELRPEFLWNFNKQVINRFGIPFYGLAGDAIQVGLCTIHGTELELLLSDYPWQDILAMAALVAGPNDGVVAVTSAMSIPYNDSRVVPAVHTSSLEPLVHSVYAPTYFQSFALPNLKVTHGLVPYVPPYTSLAPQNTIPLPPLVNAQAVENQQNNQIILSDYVQINPGGTVTIPINGVNGTELGVSLIAPPDLTSALHNPSNTEVSKIVAYSNDASQTFRQHLVPNPQVGNWTLKLTNQGATSIYVEYTAWLVDSSITLGSNLTPLDANRYRIEATFTNAGAPILNATVTARFTDTNNVETNSVLHDDGLNGDIQANDGIYTTVTNSLVPGNYFLDIHAQGAGVERFMFTTFTVASADLAVTLTDSSDPVTPGSSLDYTVTITNNGPTTATNIVLKDTLPTNITYLSAEGAACSKSGTLLTCNAGSLSEGGSAVITIHTQVKTGVSGTLTSTAVVSSDAPDPVSANNTATESTLISAPAPNDNFSTATVISSLPFTKTQSTRIATSSVDDPNFGCGWQIGHTVWYKYTATTNTALRFTTAGSDFNTVLSVWSGTSLATLARQGCSDDDPGLQTSTLDLAVASGTTYYVLIGGYDGASGSLHLAVQTAPSPANDNFNNAVDIGTLPYTTEQNVVAATAPANDPLLSANCTTNTVGRSVWYKFTSTGQAIELSTRGSNFDTVLSVWTGTLGSLTPIACDDDGGGANTSLLHLLTTSGTTYYVMVNSVGTTRSNLLFSAADITASIPANDTFANAISIPSLPYNDSKNTSVTLTNADDPAPDCISNVRGTVWYAYTATSTEPLRFSTDGSNFDTVLSIWTGTAGNLTQVACNDNAGTAKTSTIDMVPTNGTTYYIMVGGAFGSNGMLQFAAKNLSAINDDFNNAINMTSLPFVDSRNTTQTIAAVDDPAPNCGYNGGKTVWYKYTPSVKNVLRFSTLGSSYDTILSVWTGTRGSLVQVGCNDNTSDYTSQLDIVMTAGTTYYIMVAGYNGANGTLEFAASDITSLVSANDDFDNAKLVTSLPFNATINNRIAFPAADDPTPSCQTSGKTNSVWYKITPANKTVLRLTTQAASFNHAVSIWTGTRGSLVQAGCFWNYSGYTTQYDVTLNAGTPYYIMLAGVNASGDIVLSLSDATSLISSNDDFDNAENITSLPFSDTINNRVAFTVADDPTPSCQTSGKTNSVWYKITPANKTVLHFITQNASFNHAVSVWTGTRGSLVQAGCFWNYSGYTTQYDVTLNAGTTYYIMLAGVNASGDIVLNLSDVTSAISSNDDFDNAENITSLPFTTNIDNRVTFPAADDPTPGCQTSGKTNSVWYKIMPANKTILRFVTQNANFNHAVSVWTGTRGSLVQAGCFWNYSGYTTQYDLTLTAGTTYYIMLAGVNVSGDIVLNLSDATSAISSNDDFDSAKTVTSLPFTTNIDNRVAFPAADDPIPSCQTNGKTNSVWYKITPANQMMMRFITQNANFNHAVSIWTGTRGSLVQAGCFWNNSGYTSQYNLTLNAGTTYYIMLTGVNASGDIVLNLSNVTGLIPSNDDFNSAKTVTSLPFTANIDNRVAFPAADDPTPSCQSSGKTNSLWYKITPTNKMVLRSNTQNANFNHAVSIWTGTRGSLVQVGCAYAGSGNIQLDVTFNAGTTYYIMLAGANASGDVVLNLSDVTGLIPSNDDFDNARNINAFPYTDSLNTSVVFAAVDDPTPSCQISGKTNTVWYKLVAAVTGTVKLNTIGSTFNTVLSVWTGTRGSLAQVACNDNASGVYAGLDLAATSGTTYYIMVSGVNASGDLMFTATNSTAGVPPNDDFANATALTPLPFAQLVNTQLATTAANDPSPSCYTTARTNSVWYQFTPATNMILRLITQGANFTRSFSVWTGTVNSLTQVSCTYAGSGSTTQLDVALNAGTTYYIMIGGASASGTLTFTAANVTNLVSGNDDIANAKNLTSLPYTENVDNRVAFPAANDPTPSCYTTAKTNTVWYKITPASKMALRLVTQGANFTRAVSVWTGAVNSLTQVGCAYASSSSSTQLDVALSAGTTYYIMIGGVNASGTFTFTATNVTSLVSSNDDIANAKNLTSFPYTENVDNQVAFPAANDPTPSCYTTAKTNTVWYKITPASKMALHLVTQGANFTRSVSVWTGAVNSLTQVACTYASSSNSTQLDVALNAGTTYYIMIGGVNASGTFTFTATNVTSLVPSNDDIANAKNLTSLPYTENIDNRVAFPAANDPTPSCYTTAKTNTVWYKITPASNTALRLITQGADFTRAVSVWTGAVNSLSQVACAYASSGNNTQLDIAFNAGTTYYIMIGGVNASGTFTFTATDVTNLVSSNDDIANAKDLTSLPYSENVDNRVGFVTVNDPTPSCYTTAKTNTVWYKITPGATTMLRLMTQGADFTHALSIWTGAVNSLAEIDCSYSYGSNLQLDVALSAGTTYYIMIGGVNDSGTLTFTATDLTPLIPANSLFEKAALIGSLPFSDNIDTQITFPSLTNPTPTCYYSTVGSVVWYRYTAPSYSQIDFSTFGSSYDTVLSIWVMTNNGLLQVSCNDNNGSLTTSDLKLQATAGTMYYIMAASKNTTGGFLQFTATPLGNNLGTITGHVFQTDGSTPIAGAPVWVDGWVAPVCTDASGAYSITGLTSGQGYTVSAGGDSGPCVVFNYAQEWWQEAVSPISATPITATAAGVDHIDFTLQDVPLETDLSVTKSSAPLNVMQGGNLDYTFIVANNGPLRATDVVVTDQLPAQTAFLSSVLDNNTNGSCTVNNGLLTCTFSRMPAGKQTYVTLHLRVGAAAVSPLVSTIQVTGAETDPNAANNNTSISIAIAVPPLDTPSQISPTYDQTLATDHLMFKWSSVPEATSYELKFGTANPPLSPAISLTTTQYVPPSPLWPGTYYWTVRAIGANGRVSEWSDVWPVNLVSPPNAAPVRNFFTTPTPTLTWAAVSWAEGYEVQVATDSSFTQISYDNDAIGSDKVSIQTEELPNGTYFWHVRAKQSNGTWGQWSITDTFVIFSP